MKIKKDYRIAQSSVANVKPEDLLWAVLEDAWNAYAQCPRPQLATLLRRFTYGQRAFVAVNGLLAEVNNGGIHQYLWNSSGDLFQEALIGLGLVGAAAHARLLKKVARLFPDPRVLQNRRRRRKALEKIKTEATGRLFDGPFYKLEQRKRTSLKTLLLAYLKKHKDEFILPAGMDEELILPSGPGARDYRVPATEVAKLRGEKLHWALIRRLWDDYWEPLKKGRQEMLDFLPTLSAGQRALIAIDLLDKTVQSWTGFKHFLGAQIGADVLTTEVLAGFELLGATAYADVLKRALAVGGDLPDVNRRVTDASQLWNLAKKSADEAAIEAARQAFREAYEHQHKREEELHEPLKALSDEYKTLLKSADQKIEPFVEAYFDAHPEDFLRATRSDDGRSKGH